MPNQVKVSSQRRNRIRVQRWVLLLAALGVWKACALPKYEKGKAPSGSTSTSTATTVNGSSSVGGGAGVAGMGGEAGQGGALGEAGAAGGGAGGTGTGGDAPLCPDESTLCNELCVATLTDNLHCGGCNAACAGGSSCQNGNCVCQDGLALCPVGCVNLTTDEQNCGVCGATCPGNEECVEGVCACPGDYDRCEGTCVDVNSAPDNCGSCGVDCGDQVCSNGSCSSVCGDGLTECSQACVDTNTSIEHCGICDTACPAGQSCEAGNCVCPGEETFCDGGCIDTDLSSVHCGACGNACGTGLGCTEGSCTCTGGQTSCDDTCVDTMSNPIHCGICNETCLPGQSCQDGSCQCPSEQTECSNACVDTMTDSSHCGGCGQPCLASQSCVSGNCQCPGSQTVCGNACVNTNTNESHCGQCNTACSTSATCTAGKCIASCSAPDVRITEVDVGATVTYDAAETSLKPLVISAIPSGGSRLAWMGADGMLHITRLDANDQVVGNASSLVAGDFQDMYADDTGGVALLTRLAQGSGTYYCGADANLCAGSSTSNCYDSYLVRFNSSGTETWATKLTTSSASLPPYSTGPMGPTVYFVWWYQHHGRIAFDGTNYGAYFADAISISEGGCINIHQADRMQVVGPTGTLLTSHADAFDVGCNHSWNVRLLWDPTAAEFINVCVTDAGNRVALPAPYRTIYPVAVGSGWLGDIALGAAGGYWAVMSSAGTLRLIHFSSGAADQDIVLGSADDSHLARFGPGHLLAGWGTNPMTLQVRNATDGSAVSQTFTALVPNPRFQSFKEFPDGSVAIAVPGTSATKIRILRVLPCSN